MVVRQNSRCSHVELQDSQLRVLLYVLEELISQGSRIRFAIDGNLPHGLVVRSDSHVGGGQTFEKMQQDFDRVITRIDGRSQRLPILFRRADKGRLRRIVRNTLVKASNRPGKAQFAVLSHGVNKHLAFRVNKNRVSLRGIRTRALRGVYGHLSRDATVLQQWRSHLGKLFVSDRDSRNHTFTLALLDQLKVSCYFVSRERQHLLDLDPNHFRKLCRVDSWQTKSLGKYSRNRQPKHKIIARCK